MVSVRVLTISAKPELESEELEELPPRLPAATAAPVPEVELDPLEESDEVPVEDELEPISVPTESLDSEAITPATGA
jgi:hypothetical protein